MKNIIILSIILTLVGCSKEEKSLTTFLECDEIGNNLKEYKGETIKCEHHYMLTEFNGDQYIELIAHCDDLTRPYVFNENCEDICENGPYTQDSPCSQYLEGRETIEILLITK